MKNVKGFVSAAATLCLLSGGVACGGSSANEPPASPTVTTTTAAPTTAEAAPTDTHGINPIVTSTAQPPQNSPPAPQPEATLTDGQIAGIASRVDLAEIDAGKLALTQGKSPKVKQFAQHMVSAHSAVEAKLSALLKAQGITVGESTLCDKLTADTGAQKQALMSQSGFDFDRAYMGAQLKDHQDVLALMDDKLIVQAQNPQLKAALQATRAKVIEHIQMAKDALNALPAQ